MRFVALRRYTGSGLAQQNGRVKMFNYPAAPTSDHADDYHGTRVADPYRPLEDPDSAPTRAWIEAENRLTFAYLEQIPARKKIRARLKELLNYERFSVPEKRGTRYFYSRNSGLQNQSVLYWLPALDAEPRVLLDPNTLSADGTVAVSATALSEDGALLAYSLSSSGSDWQEWHVREVATGKELPDLIQWSKFSGASFSKDCKGFFYSRYDQPKAQSMLRDANYYQKLYYHRLGTPQPEDTLIYQRGDQKEWGFSGSVTDDGEYLIIHISEGTDRKNRVYYTNLTEPDSTVMALLDEKDAVYHFIDNDGPVFWFVTSLSAPLGRVIAVDTRNRGREHWKTIIAESSETMLGASILDNKFVVSYLKDAHSEVRLFGMDGGYLRTVETLGLGTIAGFGGKRTDKCSASTIRSSERHLFLPATTFTTITC
jgi:prolyl oligopeptidase